jgi:hypothetical protein
VADVVVLLVSGFRKIAGVVAFYRQLGIPESLIPPTVMLPILLGGPICVVLGKIAMRDIRRHSELRGESLAEIAIAFGWLWTCAIMGLCLIAAILYLINLSMA